MPRECHECGAPIVSGYYCDRCVNNSDKERIAALESRLLRAETVIAVLQRLLGWTQTKGNNVNRVAFSMWSKTSQVNLTDAERKILEGE